MLLHMTALLISQDRLGWKNFMEGRRLIEFYQMQFIHLACISGFLNGED